MINSDPITSNEQENVELWLEIDFPQRAWVAMDGKIYKENQPSSNDLKCTLKSLELFMNSFNKDLSV